MCLTSKYKHLNRLITILLLLIIPLFSYTQKDSVNRNIFTYEVIDGDTIPILKLKEFKYKDPEYEKQWRRTVFFTRRVYPYAQIIDSVIRQHDSVTNELKKQKRSKRKIKKYNKKLKKKLSKEYGTEIKNMSVTRGQYLAKLVHRNTDKTIFQLIKKYKNGSNALFWQLIMKLYGGANLKAKYEPDKEDWMLALVLKEIEEGRIQVIPRSVQKQKLEQHLSSKKKKKKKKK